MIPIKVSECPDALREGVIIEIDGEEVGLVGKWTMIEDGAILVLADDRAYQVADRELGLLRGSGDYQTGTWTSDPRAILALLKSMLVASGVEGVPDPRQFEQDPILAARELQTLKKDHASMIAQRVRDSRG